MPRFFFDYRDAAGTSRDEVGLQLSGRSEAVAQARRAVAEAISDEAIAASESDAIAMAIEVRTETGELIYTAVGMAGSGGPASGGPDGGEPGSR